METAHLGEEEGFHFSELLSVEGIGGEVRLVFTGPVVGEIGELPVVVLGEVFVRIVCEVEELGFAHVAVVHIVLDKFPIALANAAHTGFSAAAIDAEEDVADGFIFAGEDGFEADALAGLRWVYAGEVADGGERIEQVDVPLGAGTGPNAGALDDIGDAPGVFVEVLFALQAVTTDGHAVVGGVDDVGVVEFAHGGEFIQDTADLDVDVFIAGKFAAEFVADGALVAACPDAADFHFVAQAGMTVVEGMGGEVVDGELRLFVVGYRQRVLVPVVGRAVFGEELGCTVARVVRMGEAEVDEERFSVLSRGAIVQVVEYILGMPGAAGFGGAAAFGGIVADCELFVGTFVAVAAFAGAHGVVTRAVEDGGHGILFHVGRHQALLCAPSVGEVPQGASGHHHVPRGRTHGAAIGAHVIGAVEHHALGGEPVDVRRSELRFGVVDLQVEGRLVVDDDEEYIRGGLSWTGIRRVKGRAGGQKKRGDKLAIEFHVDALSI